MAEVTTKRQTPPPSGAGQTPAQPGRALRLRARADLVIQPMHFRGRRYWGVKDPLALRFYHLRDEEHFILGLLDGRTSLEEIMRRFERQFAPARLSLRQLQAFFGMLHRQGLIVAQTAGQGDELLRRRQEERRAAVWRALSNPLAIRFPGVDPQRFLSLLYPEVRWLFSPGFVALAVLLVFSALTLCAVEFRTLVARLPDFHSFFNFRNALCLLAAVAVVKVLHELGHGLACRHFGGDCHELGLMLLVFTPCLYCNVSDAWMMPNKWRRVAISAAGMYVEMIIASACTLLWWFSEPGLFNSLCLDLMFVCSVNTLLFNGNPLLRYDGYYILADVLEAPNLGQQSAAVVRRWAARWFTGVDAVPERMLPESGRGLLAAYAVASFAYRWLVVALILWFLYHVLRPARLEVLAFVLAAFVLAGAAARSWLWTWRLIREPHRRRDVKWLRMLARCAVAAGLLSAVFLIPLPHRVKAPVVIRPAQARGVFVAEPGRLIWAAEPGQRVLAGEVVARLENHALELEIEKLAGEFAQQQRRVETLTKRQNAGDRAAIAQLPTARQTLAALQARLDRRREDGRRLTLSSPRGGVVLPPPRREPTDTPGEPPTWSGTPLDRGNRGSFLESGTLLCQIGGRRKLEAVVLIDQGDLEFIRAGQSVRLELDQSPGRALWGTITQIAQLDVDIAPRELIGDGELPTRTDETGLARPLNTAYRARVEFDDPGQTILPGASGQAKVHAEPETLARRIYRFLSHTFRFEL